MVCHPSFRGSSRPRDQTRGFLVSPALTTELFTTSATGKPTWLTGRAETGVAVLGPQGVVCQCVWWCRNTLEGAGKGTELKRGIRQHEKERYSRQTGTRGPKHGSSWWLISQVRTAVGAQDGEGMGSQWTRPEAEATPETKCIFQYQPIKKYFCLLLLLSRFSCVRLCATPWTAAHQAPQSLGFSRQGHWSGLPFPSLMHESEKWKGSRSVVSDTQRPHGLQHSRPLSPWDFPGKSTGVLCHCLLRIFV